MTGHNMRDVSKSCSKEISQHGTGTVVIESVTTTQLVGVG